MALLFGGGLDRLGQHRRIFRAGHFGAGFLQRMEDARHRAIGIDCHALARKPFERGDEFGAVAQRHRIAEMLGEFG